MACHLRDMPRAVEHFTVTDIKTGGPALICRHCGQSFIPKEWQVKSRDYRCLPCKCEKQNAHNAAKGQVLRDEAKEAYQRRRQYYTAYWQAAKNDPIHVKKRAARRKVQTEIEAGRLTRKVCEVCGESKTDAHHHDYDSPLNIKWLCRKCHFKEEGHGPAKHV